MKSVLAGHAGRLLSFKTEPVLMIAAERDSLIPLRDVERCASRIPRVKKVSLPVGHFDVYTGEWLTKVSAMEADFLAEQLL